MEVIGCGKAASLSANNWQRTYLQSRHRLEQGMVPASFTRRNLRHRL